ncbi:hypothetical protein EGW08_000964 [Elysia chlorotica]|uniref:C-type lectin domain-containing protein n=1 Tax=Elysia chlorotica TaxID=188477 RepID=A0A433UBW5_ELYCH|nr:hypothetical protein EGW08_000964 [Elysia chlorotica]
MGLCIGVLHTPRQLSPQVFINVLAPHKEPPNILARVLLVLGVQLAVFTGAITPEPPGLGIAQGQDKDQGPGRSQGQGQGQGQSQSQGQDENHHEANVLSNAPSNRSSVCPRLWQRASTSGHEFLGGGSFMTSTSDAPPKLCVWVNERRAPWHEALSACRRRNGFLVKLETILELEGGRSLMEDIRQRGLDSVWTGMHHHKGVLLWDELKPTMVTPYFGPTQQYGWKRRLWDFDTKSFINGGKTCGALVVGEGQADSRAVESSQEIPADDILRAGDTRSMVSERQASYTDSLLPAAASGLSQSVRRRRRRRRSTLQAPGDPFIPLPPVGDVLGNPTTFKVDYEDVANNQSPTQEARIENFQQFLSNQGFQEKYVESIGESVPTNDPQTFKGQEEIAGIQATTLSTTTTPDHSNLEDDDFHVVTKRDASPSLTPPPPLRKLPGEKDVLATGITPTSAPRFSQQNSVKGTSLPASTHAHEETTLSPVAGPTKSVDDLLNRLLQASLLNPQSNLPIQAPTDRVKTETKAFETTQGTLFSKFQTQKRKNSEGIDLTLDKTSELSDFRTSTTIKPSHSHDQLISMDMLMPNSKSVLSEGSKSSSNSNQSSSDTSSSPFDSNEFLSKERKKFQENMLKFSPNLSPQQTESADSTTEAPDDSAEVTDSPSSMESTTESPNLNNTEMQSKEYNSREMANLWGSENNTNSLQKHPDLDVNSKSNPDLPLDTLSVDSAEIFDSASNLTDSTEEIFNESNSTITSTDEELTKMLESERVSSQNSLQSKTVEEVGTSSAEDSREISGSLEDLLFADSASLPEPDNYMELDDCQEEHPSVCVTEAIEELELVGHCDRGWYGHRLLDRCYRPIGLTLSEFEARQRCLQRGAVLAMADTEFYGDVLSLLLNYFMQERRFNSKIWVDAGLNMAVQADGSCWTLQDGSLAQETCARRQSFFCQKDAHFHGFPPELRLDKAEPDTYVHNMTSFQPQTLLCPLQVLAANDVIIWFKDGRPIKDLEEEEERGFFRFKNGQLSNSLDLDLSILKRVGRGGDRIPKAAMLQGTYWCEVWRRAPRLHRVPSHKIFLKFSDVISLHGHILTEPTSYVEAAMFNSMGLLVGLPVDIERRLATINKNITHHLRAAPLLVRDVITFVKRVSASEGKFEFVTYICLTTGDPSSHMRRVVIDQYIANFRQILEQQETEIRQEWNIALPLEAAVKVFMTDGIYTGRAWCRGDLQTGAYWDNIRVTRSCEGWEWQDSSSESYDNEDGASSNTDETDDEDEKFRLNKPPNSALLELDEIEIEEGNVADVTERLTNVLDDLEELSESDVSAVAQVVDNIVAVRRPPTEVSDKLVQTVSKVMDAAPEVLKKAEKESRALSR